MASHQMGHVTDCCKLARALMEAAGPSLAIRAIAAELFMAECGGDSCAAAYRDLMAVADHLNGAVYVYETVGDLPEGGANGEEGSV